MKKKMFFKKCVSAQLILALTAGLVGSSLSGLFVKPKEVEAATVEYNKASPVYNIIPEAITNNSKTMSDYVIRNGGLNVNDGFVKVKSDYCDGPSTLSMSKISHSSDEYNFKAYYHWDFGGLKNDRADLFNSDQLDLRFQAEIIADKHSSFLHHWDKIWDVGKVNIGFVANNSIVLGMHKNLNSWSAAQNSDDSGQRISASWPMNSNSDFAAYNWMRYEIYNSSCPCGDAGANASVFYVVDKVKPYVTETYFSTDRNGSNKVEAGNGFTSGQTAYITLAFNENIRFADNNAREINIKLYYADAYTSQSDNTSYVNANLVKLEGNKLTFKFETPSKGEGKTYLYFVRYGVGTDPNTSKSWTDSNYSLALLDKNGNVYTADCGVKSGLITDLAGNAMELSNSKSSVPKVFCDNIAPELKMITMTGSMMNNKAGEELDRSSAFAGVGDTLKFTTYFSEEICNYNGNSVKAVLNVKDVNTKQNIKLNLDYSSRTNAKNVYGADAMNVDVTYFVFKDLKITANMVPEGEKIQIISIEGIESVNDRSGNKIKGYDLSNLAPKQQITIDNIAPGTSTSLKKDNGEVYIANPKSDTLFTIPIITKDSSEIYDVNGNKLNENEAKKYISGVSEKGQFSLAIGNESQNFKYSIKAVDNFEIEKEDFNTWQTGSSSTSAKEYKYDFLQPGDGNVVYLHIKLEEGVNYNFNENDGIMFVGTINMYPVDYAGNSSKQSYILKHKMDSVAPDIKFTGNTFDVNYDELYSTLTMKFNVSDTYGIKDIQYYWDYYYDVNTSTSQEKTSPQKLESEGIMDPSSDYTVTTKEIPFEVDGDEGRAGTHKLTVEVKDFAGNIHSDSAVYEFKFTKGKVAYEVAKNDITNPYTIPDVILKNAVGGDVETSSMVIFNAGKVSETAGKEYRYYVYIMDPSKSYVNIFDGITDYSNFDNSRWFSFDGNLKDEGNQFKTLGRLNKKDLHDWLTGYYGEMEITFVASPEIKIWSDSGSYGNYNYTYAQSSVATEKIYLANDAEYKFELLDIKDETGESIRDNLIYSNGEEKSANTISTLDNAYIDIRITNVKDGTSDVEFGLNAWDVENSYVELYREKISNDTPIWTWELEKQETQRLFIPEGVIDESGQYSIRVVLYDIEGNVYRFEPNESYLVDMRTNDVYLDSYYKGYVYLYEENGVQYDETVITRNDVDLSDVEECKELTIGLNDIVEGWSIDPSVSSSAGHRITFCRPSISNWIDYMSIEENIKIKIYNSADKNGTENAIALDGENYTTITMIPQLVNEFTKQSYGTVDNLILPLVAGYNKITIEITNTNNTVVVKELVINVETMSCEFTIKSDKTVLREIISADYNIAVADRTITFKEFDTIVSQVSDKYTYDKDTKLYFYAYDTIGTLYGMPYEVYDVDGVKPQYIEITNDSYHDGSHVFRFQVYAYDNDLMSVEDLTITFDTEYSAILSGLTGEERREYIEQGSQLTMKIPVCLDKDENGEFIPWVEYGSRYNGIYKTLVSDSDISAEGSKYRIDVWGTFKYDEEIGDGASVERTITANAHDYNGNCSSASLTLSKLNEKPYLNFGGKDENGKFFWDYRFDLDGSIGVYSEKRPISKITSYGGTEIEYIVEEWSQFDIYYSTLPMIYCDGIYNVTFYDLFGQEFTQEMMVTSHGTTDIQFEYSETEPTNSNVTVSAKALLPGDKIVSIVGLAKGEDVTGVIYSEDNTQAYIEMPYNGTVTVTTAMGVTHTVRVVNIDKEIEPVSIRFLYNYSEEPKFVDGSTDTVIYEAVAMVDCDEDLYGTNGPLEFTFKEGVAAGSSYTFEYMDEAGNTGQITAILPYNIYKHPVPGVDDVAPTFKINIHAMRDNVYKYIIDGAQREDAAEMNVALKQYIAQGYALDFDITDASPVNVIVKTKGSSAPTSYNDTSDTIEGIKVVDNYVYITKNNVEFDIYLIDKSDNITAYKNVNVTSIDQEAPAVTVNTVAKKNEKGDNYVQVEYVVESGEFIRSLDSDSYTMFIDKTYTDTNWSTGEDLLHYYMRYYKDIFQNGENKFTYKDIYGNIGTAVVDIQGIDNVAPVILSTKWYGTSNNGEPSVSKIVNRDITAVISVSKAVNNVNLYYYDENAANHVGEPIVAESGVYATFNGTRVSVVYTDNVDKKIVAEIFASSGGKKVYKEFDAVACIDKLPPTVTIKEEVLADNRTYKEIIFETNEGTVLMENNSMYQSVYEKEHKLTVVDCGEYTVKFVDIAGNVTSYTVVVDDIDDVLLELMFSKSEDGSNSTADAYTLDLVQGDTVYIMTNKIASVEVAGVTLDVDAGEWNEFLVGDESGFCVVNATDTVTKRVVSKSLSVKLKDMQAPNIYFDTNTVCANEDLTIDMINELLNSGVTVNDDKDGNISTYSISGVPSEIKEGLYTITYKAEDKAGNIGSNIRTLYICSKNTPIVTVNGETACPYGTTVVESLTEKLEISQVNESYVIMWKEGKNTTAQMKNGSNLVTGDSFEVPHGGFYTIYVRTQSRKEMVVYIYVEE